MDKETVKAIESLRIKMVDALSATRLDYSNYYHILHDAAQEAITELVPRIEKLEGVVAINNIRIGEVENIAKALGATTAQKQKQLDRQRTDLDVFDGWVRNIDQEVKSLKKLTEIHNIKLAHINDRILDSEEHKETITGEVKLLNEHEVTQELVRRNILTHVRHMHEKISVELDKL